MRVLQLHPSGARRLRGQKRVRLSNTWPESISICEKASDSEQQMKSQKMTNSRFD
jgi:hypothetical protein